MNALIEQSIISACRCVSLQASSYTVMFLNNDTAYFWLYTTHGGPKMAHFVRLLTLSNID